jgi:hypothetical protein
VLKRTSVRGFITSALVCHQCAASAVAGITRAFAAAPARGGVAHPPQQLQQPQPPAPRERAIIHLDMDCFFASVAAVGRPEFAGRPLAVCQSNSAQGSGEVSCVNYDARRFGISAGMRISEAKRRCPDLLVVPYEFEKYTDITEQVRGSWQAAALRG